MVPLTTILSLAGFASVAYACDDCYGPQTDVVMTRNVRRMQPDAQNATSGPKAPLAWGQLNVLHTTDTHGWLEGHIKEQNYGADWGDYVSFTRQMKDKAKVLGVDLLLVDTGDLHDGAGLSDATSPNGLISNPIFENIDYDVLTIGNHELYISEIAYEHFYNFSKAYGDRYLTSNVQILNPATNQFEYIGKQYRYFTTPMGLRVMAFGVLYDFTGNSNVSRVIKAATMVNQTWFQQAVNFSQPIDLFLVTGHNPVRLNGTGSTLGTVYNAIRKARPGVPIQMFGGHTHIRDFAIYDQMATGLESGRYCETLGWFSMNGLRSNATTSPKGQPTPSQVATANVSMQTASYGLPLPRYSRRYLDWNRRTFEYHAQGSQDNTFDFQNGKAVTDTISAARKQLNLTQLFGCAPQTWCESCAPFGSSGNIYSLLSTALSAVVVNTTRATIPRLIILNTGSVRFDLVKGPFTYDDSFIVSPFTDAFQYLSNVPYAQASKVLGILNAGAYQKRDLDSRDFGFSDMNLVDRDLCRDPAISHNHLEARSYATGKVIRRQNTALTPGYTTKDDLGSDGDDTVHSSIPYYSQPNDFQANASFPTDGSTPATVDLIFLDYIAPNVISALNSIGGSYTTSQVAYYLPPSFTTNSYLPIYAQKYWQANVPNCAVGQGVGYPSK